MDERFVICVVGECSIAIPVEQVLEMVRLRGVTLVPKSSPWLLGVMPLRDALIPLVDTRKLLGLQTAAEEVGEMVDMLRHRQEDHRHWVEELERALAERRPFTLTTDPTQCAFGRWYYSYKPQDQLLAYQLKRLESPHRQIHELAVEVEDLKRRAEFGQAQERVTWARATLLHTLIDLIDETVDLLQGHRRDIAILCPGVDKTIGLVVDYVENISTFVRPPEPVVTMDAPGGGKLIAGVGEIKGTGKLAYILPPGNLGAAVAA